MTSKRFYCDNHSIDFGENIMSVETLSLANAVLIAVEKNGGKGATLEICKQFNKSRAQIYNLVTLAKIGEPYTQYFIDGYIGMNPLVDLYRDHGKLIIEPLKKLAEEKSQLTSSKSKKITKNEIESILKSSSLIEGSSSHDEDEIAQLQSSLCTIEARESILDIRGIFHECSQQSQISSGIYMPSHDMIKVKNLLKALEQWMDEIRPDQTGEQGDPLDQSIGSYVFDNMVEPTNHMEHSSYRPEDENQDIHGNEFH